MAELTDGANGAGQLEAELDAEAAQLQEAGGLRKSRYRLETPLALRAHAVRIYSEMRSGRLSGVEGNRQLKALATIGQFNEALDLMKRLERLEQHIDAQRAGRGRGR